MKPRLLCQYVQDIYKDPRDRLEVRMSRALNEAIPCLSKSQYKEGFLPVEGEEERDTLRRHFEDHLTVLYTRSHEISMKLFELLIDHIHYPEKKTLLNAIENEPITPSVLRILQYVSLTHPSLRNETIELAQDHTDIGLVTLMPCSSAQTLEIRSNKGEWIQAEIGRSRNIITVIGGEQLSFISNQFYQPARHRILNTTEGRRISFPFLMRLPNYIKVETVDKKESKLAKDILNHIFK